MKVSQKLMGEIMEAINTVMKKHKGVVDSYKFKCALVTQSTELTLKLRDMTDRELQTKDGK
jgi:hypothetical protein